MVLNSNHRMALLRMLEFAKREEKTLYDAMVEWEATGHDETTSQYQMAQITHHVAWLKSTSIQDMLISNEADM